MSRYVAYWQLRDEPGWTKHHCKDPFDLGFCIDETDAIHIIDTKTGHVVRSSLTLLEIVELTPLPDLPFSNYDL